MLARGRIDIGQQGLANKSHDSLRVLDKASFLGVYPSNPTWKRCGGPFGSKLLRTVRAISFTLQLRLITFCPILHQLNEVLICHCIVYPPHACLDKMPAPNVVMKFMSHVL